MSFNFFDWIRDGVKTSVLRGVSEAVEVMGAPPDESSKDKILGFLRNDNDNETPVRRIAGGATSSGVKKLGRSLNDVAAKEAS